MKTLPMKTFAMATDPCQFTRKLIIYHGRIMPPNVSENSIHNWILIVDVVNKI